jgi:AraC-like DNA-binding protein/mannose-6-phosphate isomerase-like protein (cupin superfamily)
MSGFQITPLKSSINIDSLITIHYFEYQKDFVFKGERHDFWEFLYVDKGEVTVTSDQSKINLIQGDIIFHKPNEFHSVKCNGIIAPNLVVISFETYSPSMKYFENKIMKINNNAKALLSIIMDVSQSIFTYDLGTSYSKKLILKERFDEESTSFIKTSLESFLSLLIIQGEDARTYINQRSNIYQNEDTKRVAILIAYLKENIGKTFSLENICDDCMMSKSLIQRIFKEQTGWSIMGYFHRMKINQAKLMIRKGDMNFTQIADTLAYTSVQYFSRQFKKIEGVSPSEYSKSISSYI